MNNKEVVGGYNWQSSWGREMAEVLVCQCVKVFPVKVKGHLNYDTVMLEDVDRKCGKRHP